MCLSESRGASPGPFGKHLVSISLKWRKVTYLVFQKFDIGHHTFLLLSWANYKPAWAQELQVLEYWPEMLSRAEKWTRGPG